MKHRTIISLLITLALLVSVLPAQAAPLAPEAAPGPFNKTSPVNGATNQLKTLNLSWGSSANATSYEYCVDKINNNLCDTTWTSVGINTSAAVNLEYKTTYYWQVRAKNIDGTTEANTNTWWSFTTYFLPVPFNKSGPASGSSNQPTTVTLSWGNSDNLAGYEYCVDTINNNACDQVWTDAGLSTSVVINWLDYLTTYYWQVRAWNSSGWTEANGGIWWSLTTQGLPPGAFNKNNPTNNAYWQPTNPTLSWLASPFATSYQYCIDTLDNNACDAAWTSVGNNTSVGLVGLTDGVTYSWQARALNGLGMIEADSGVWWRFTVDTLPPVAFFKVKPLNVAIDQKTGPTLEWTRSVNAASYEYCIDKIANGTCDTVWINVGSNISTTLNGLNYNTVYHWQVRARNPNGLTDANGGWWSFQTINTTVLKKLSPTNNVVIPNGFYLEWTPLNGAIYYEVCIDSVKNTRCDKKWVKVGSKTQVWIEGLRPGTNFYWQVRARTALKKVKADGGVWWRFHIWP